MPWRVINSKDNQLHGCARNSSRPIAVAGRSRACTVLARSNAGIMCSNPTQGMDVYVRLFCVYAVLYIGSGLAKGQSSVQEVLPTVYRVKKMKKRSFPTKDCRAIDRDV
jgi:hypothetical protein